MNVERTFPAKMFGAIFGTSAHRAGDRPPKYLAFRSSKAFVTFVVAYAVFADQFIFAVIVPVMPFTLHSQVGVAEDSVQYWIAVLLAVFGAATTVASPIWGWYTDRLTSRRIPFLSGLLVIGAATIMIWLAPNIGLQIGGRFLQGLSSAIVWVTGLAMIADSVDEEEIGQYVGYLGITMMVGTLIAPLIGGVVLAKVGYNAVFELTLGIIGIDVLLRFTTVESSVAQRWSRYHNEQAIYLETHDMEVARGTRSGELQDPTIANNTSVEPVSSPRPISAPAVFALLSSRRLLAALWASLMVGAIFAGLETVLPLQTQQVFGWGSIGGGLIFLPLTVPAFLGPIVGSVCDRYGSRWLVLAGFLLLCPFMTLLLLVKHNFMSQKVLLCALLTLIGCCFTLTLDPVIAEVAYIVEQKAKTDLQRYGTSRKIHAQAFGLFNMAYSLGNTVGPLIAGLIRDAAGWTTMAWVLGLLSGVTAIPTGLWCGGWIGNKTTRSTR